MMKGAASMATIDGLPPLREVIRTHELVARKQLAAYLINSELAISVTTSAVSFNGR